jgi:hypothetical protein
MRRRRRDNTLSLFAFQDIITGVAGVMLFVLLLLVVQLALRTATASTELGGDVDPISPETPQIKPPPDARQELQQMREELERSRQRNSELLVAEASDLDAEIEAARTELEELMGDAAAKKSRAEEIQSQLASSETDEQRTSTIAERNALKSRLQELEQEQLKHAGGKLIAFKAASAGVAELWIIDIRATAATIFNVASPQDAVTVTYERFEPPTLMAQSIRSGLGKQTQVRNVVVLLRPSIAGPGTEILDALRSTGLRVALELLDEDMQVTQPSDQSLAR